MKSLLSALSLVTAVVPLASTLPVTSVVEERQTGSVQWSTCPEGMSGPGLECGSISVPLDYDKPQGDSISIAMVRVKTNCTSPKGSVVFNPGGPGGSGIALVAGLAALGPGLPPYDLLQQYNLIGVDPRGVGASTPLKCDPELWNKRVVTAVANDADYDALVQHYKEVGEACARLTGPMFEHLDTISVAKDFEQVRQALGEDKLNLVGLSYGTQIAQSYAELYPEQIGRFLLDGLVDHSQAPTSAVQTEATTYDTTLRQFFQWCKANETCALHGQDMEAFWNELVSKAQSKPIPAPGCQQTGEAACRSDVSYEELLYNVQGKLTQVESAPQVPGWDVLSQALMAASKDDNATYFSSPYYTAETDAMGSWAFIAVGCQDWQHPATSAKDLQALMQQTNALSPLTKGFTQGYGYQTKCLGWPAPLVSPQRLLDQNVTKAPPMLLVNSFYDPETSVQWAVGARAQLPKSSLIFRNGSGHTSYPLPGDTAKAINAWFLEDKMPEDGSVYQS